jgi:hypothetical protein
MGLFPREMAEVAVSMHAQFTAAVTIVFYSIFVHFPKLDAAASPVPRLAGMAEAAQLLAAAPPFLLRNPLPTIRQEIPREAASKEAPKPEAEPWQAPV